MQLRQDNLNLAILEIGRPQLRKVLQSSDPVLGGPPDPEGTEDCHVRERIEVRSGAVWLWRRSQDPTFTVETLDIFMMEIQNTSEDSLV